MLLINIGNIKILILKLLEKDLIKILGSWVQKQVYYPQCYVSTPMFPKFSTRKILDTGEVKQRRCLEERYNCTLGWKSWSNPSIWSTQVAI